MKEVPPDHPCGEEMTWVFHAGKKFYVPLPIHEPIIIICTLMLMDE
jgi:hypothetical protein